MPTASLNRSRKRSAATAAVTSPEQADSSTRKTQKVSRACKARKTRCSGTLPCDRCVLRRLACDYDADYARGRPPTPPPRLAAYWHHSSVGDGLIVSGTSSDDDDDDDDDGTKHHHHCHYSRTIPEEVEAAEVERQDFDPTSGLAFFQRAHQRLHEPPFLSGSGGEQTQQLLTSAGDKPLLLGTSANNAILSGDPGLPDFPSLVEFYFETCVVTYRMFAQQRSVMVWARTAQHNAQQGQALAQGLGNAKAAILLAIVAIAILKSDRAQLHASASDSRLWDERPSLQKADRYYSMAASLVETEVGLPCLESTQARLVQVLYLLQTSRMNKAWYLLGTTWHVAAALELHRHQGRKRGSAPPDYITLQGQRRTFWVAYAIDVYLSVVLGRPRHIHDDDVDQELPAAISDEDMGLEGPVLRVDRDEEDEETDSNMDSVIAHAQLARIIGTISSEVYFIKDLPRKERLAAASRSGQELSAWRSRLPPHLSSVQPRSLIPALRRQAIAMRLAYCHAVMHANRPFLLGGGHGRDADANADATSALDASIAECIASAKTALKTVQSMAADSTLLHAFWWTPYVTFCALAVVYIWEIQQSAGGRESSDEDRKVLDLAEKCHARLARSMSADSPSWRYTVILEELRHSARVEQHAGRSVPTTDYLGPSSSSERLLTHAAAAAAGSQAVYDDQSQHPSSNPTATAYAYDDEAAGRSNICDTPLSFFQGWQTTDWRDLDASAFGFFENMTASIDAFIPGNGI
ncbi:C6 transcription factor [Apiospora phragmitis]|uniref:C6 transcription factor n=1 Tax=Apiospora phragmitis TaxID=2905665 RepID=A0ABR1T6G4_9PEZI